MSYVLEGDVESTLLKGVTALGGLCYKFVSPGNAGVPDRIVILPGGRVIFIELKRSKGVVSAQQTAQHKRMRKRGCDVRILYGKEDVKEFLDEVGK